MFCTDILGKGPLEFPGLGAGGDPSRAQNLGDGSDLFIPNIGAVEGQRISYRTPPSSG